MSCTRFQRIPGSAVSILRSIAQAKTNTIGQSIHVVRSAGRVVITGIPSDIATPMDMHELRRKEAVLYNVRRSNHETDAAVHMLREQPKRFAPMITHALADREHPARFRDARAKAGRLGENRASLLTFFGVLSSPHDVALRGMRLRKQCLAGTSGRESGTAGLRYAAGRAAALDHIHVGAVL